MLEPSAKRSNMGSKNGAHGSGPESSYMVESAALYRNSERDKQILILSKPRSRASSRAD